MIYVLLGTRAQLIKMAPIMRLLMERGIDYRYISTAQHADTMDRLHKDFNIRLPDVYLGKAQERTSVISSVLWFLGILFTTLRKRDRLFPLDGVGLVHGDTLSTLLGAMALKIRGIKVGHVESGLRSFNIFNPFPEEIIRLITFHFSDYYFCSDEAALLNLSKFRGAKINTFGNTLSDGVAYALTARKTEPLRIFGPYCIFSFHRYENLRSESRLKFILEAIELSSSTQKVLVVLHPMTISWLTKHNLYTSLIKFPNVELVPRMEFTNFINLLADSEFLMTDGGSNQEEASYLGLPCAILRSHTERREGLGKNAILLNYNIKLAARFIDDYTDYKKHPDMSSIGASKTVVDYLVKEFTL